ncbi:MAG: hypothetical protein FWE27_03535 [Defluviitaleaceae bacterium]|nr:hypothetical protein [Defluviitaleaceae bacterium]
MQPIALLNLSGKYVNGEVSLSWKYPPQSPDTVYVLPVCGTGATRRANTTEMSEHMLRDVTSGTKFKYQFRSPHGVMRCEFLVFLGNSGDDIPNMERLLDNPALTVTVTVGNAIVFYDVKTTKVENDFVKHIITLKSSCSMEQGILGYSFASCERRFSAPFPGAIERGKRKYPPFYTRVGSDVFVEVVNGTNADVQTIAKPISTFLFG